MDVAPSFSQSRRSSQTATIRRASAEAAAMTAVARSKASMGLSDLLQGPNSIGVILARGSDIIAEAAPERSSS